MSAQRAYKMSDIEEPMHMKMWEPPPADPKAARRDKKKANKTKMVVDGAGLKTLTIVVKHRGKKKK